MFGNRNDFNFNFLFGNNKFMSPNQTICKSTISDPKLKNIPSKTDMDKISPNDNTSLADNNEIGSSPDGINNKGKTPNNDKTIIGTDARRNNQQNDGKIDSFADGLNSLADTDGNSPVKPENNISNPSGISQKTKELLSLQSELAKKVTGSEVNGNKDESLLSSDNSKPMPVKLNTATPKKDDNQMLSHENEGSGITQSESGKVERVSIGTEKVKDGNQILLQSESSETTQSESVKVEQKHPDAEIMKNDNLQFGGTEISQTENSNIKRRKCADYIYISKVSYNEIQKQLGLGDRNKLIDNQANRYIKDMQKEGFDFKNEDKLKAELKKKLNEKNKYTDNDKVVHYPYIPFTKEMINNSNFAPVKITSGSANDEKSALIVDNHPEKIVDNGLGRVNKYQLPGNKNYQLESYHINKVDGIEDAKSKRQLIYNFKTGENPATLTFSNISFNTGKSESKTGNLQEKGLGKEDLINKTYIKGELITDKNIAKFIDDRIVNITNDGIKINLNKNDTFSLVSPEISKDEIIASKMKFTSTEAIDLDIRSVEKVTPDEILKKEENIKSLLQNSKTEYFKFNKEGNLKKLGKDIRLNPGEIDKLKEYLGNNGLLDKELTYEELNELLTKKNKSIFNFNEEQIQNIMDSAYVSHNNQWTEKEQERYVKDNKNKEDKCKELIKCEQQKSPPDYEVIAEAIIQLKEAEEQVNKFKAVNPGENKQATGVFERYNYNMDGEFDFKNGKNNYITITNKDSECKIEAIGKNGQSEVSNKGGFYETLHYKVKITNPPANLSDGYELLLVPGAGDITSYNENGSRITVKPGNAENMGITMPFEMLKEGEDKYIQFDYKIEGGSSLPVYVLVIPKQTK